MGKVFVTLTPKNIGQPWQKEEVELDKGLFNSSTDTKYQR
jgi:hypothetical protein